MTIKPAVLQPGLQLGNSATLIYTSPVNTTTVIRRAVFTNVTAGALTMTVYRVPSAGTAGVTNEIIAPTAGGNLAAGVSYTCPELAGMTLGPGESIYATGSAATSINAFMSGFTSV